MDKHAEVVLFESLHSTLSQMLAVYPVLPIAAKLASDEFNLAVLMKRPHIQVLDRIVQMHKMVVDYEGHARRQMVVM